MQGVPLVNSQSLMWFHVCEARYHSPVQASKDAEHVTRIMESLPASLQGYQFELPDAK